MRLPADRSRARPLVVCLVAVTLTAVLPATTVTAQSHPAVCQCVPSTAAISAAFDLAAADRLGTGYPRLPRIGVDSAVVPPTLLKAVGWVESNWLQFRDGDEPMLSYDYGYGIMQITYGMAGAFGDPLGTLPLSVQARIGGDYRYNIAFGARMLAGFFESTPAIDNHDPTALEDWYYALWAYNGWGWVNNPNNPAFSRQGTPATDPAAFPYQERVYYWIEHPPRDASGHLLWQPVHVSLPSPEQIGDSPGPLQLRSVHRQIPHLYGATYTPPPGPAAVHPQSKTFVHVTVYNTGGSAWSASKRAGFGLTYHWVEPGHRGDHGYDRSLGGVNMGNGRLTRVWRAVPIGSSLRFGVWLQAPARTGSLRVEWDMAAHGGWFSHNGVWPGLQRVEILPRQDSVAPYHDPPQTPLLSGYRARYVALTSAPAGGTYGPRTPYSETALLFNAGTETWTRSTHLALLGGHRQISLPLATLPPCRTIPVTISGLAPKKAGAHVLRWQLLAPDGRFFGPMITIDLNVTSDAVEGGREAGRFAG